VHEERLVVVVVVVVVPQIKKTKTQLNLVGVQSLLRLPLFHTYDGTSPHFHRLSLY